MDFAQRSYFFLHSHSMGLDTCKYWSSCFVLFLPQTPKPAQVFCSFSGLAPKWGEASILSWSFGSIIASGLFQDSTLQKKNLFWSYLLYHVWAQSYNFYVPYGSIHYSETAGQVYSPFPFLNVFPQTKEYWPRIQKHTSYEKNGSTYHLLLWDGHSAKHIHSNKIIPQLTVINEEKVPLDCCWILQMTEQGGGREWKSLLIFSWPMQK